VGKPEACRQLLESKPKNADQNRWELLPAWNQSVNPNPRKSFSSQDNLVGFQPASSAVRRGAEELEPQRPEERYGYLTEDKQNPGSGVNRGRVLRSQRALAQDGEYLKALPSSFFGFFDDSKVFILQKNQNGLK
jgi:hypothetical protein